jgi:diadenosine tetraphosphate (Ap4A) HIT family hydrolase
MILPASLRTRQGEQLYQDAKLDGTLKPLAEEPSIHETKYWRVIHNRFPYDEVFDLHDMLVPKRVFSLRSDMTLAEYIDLQNLIENYVEPTYQMIIDNTQHRRSILGHYHVHIATQKERQGL